MGYVLVITGFRDDILEVPASMVLNAPTPNPRSSQSYAASNLLLKMGWTVSWYSSFDSDFNYDFHVTLDQAAAPVEYNYRGLAELGPQWQGWSGEMHGISAFLS